MSNYNAYNKYPYLIQNVDIRASFRGMNTSVVYDVYREMFLNEFQKWIDIGITVLW